MSNFKVPVIAGGLALVAVIVTLIVVLSGGQEKGLYITQASGIVNIDSGGAGGGPVSPAGEVPVAEGDIISVGENSFCRVVYRAKDNSEENFFVINENSQVMVSDKFNGKDDGQILLTKGSVLFNLAAEDEASVVLRTANGVIYPEGCVLKAAHLKDDLQSYTDIFNFLGMSKIQLYDEFGNPVNDPEYLGQKMTSRIVTTAVGPYFDSLNIGFELSAMTAADLKNLIAISNFAELPYAPDELSAAFENAGDDSGLPPVPNDDITTLDSPSSIQTADPYISEEPSAATTTASYEVTAPPVNTTASPRTTSPPSQTAATTPRPTAATTTTADATVREDPFIYHTVMIVIDGEETIQEVLNGEDAIIPPDPVIEGLKFMRWDNSFDNITSDRIITAIFEPDESNVTTVNPPQNEFYTVTFIIDEMVYPAPVMRGATAVPPYNPTYDRAGNVFLEWDKPLNNITSDVTITAIFYVPEFTVIFMADGYEIDRQRVRNGDSATAPYYVPPFDSQGRFFAGWDKPFSNITSDTTITAYYNEY